MKRSILTGILGCFLAWSTAAADPVPGLVLGKPVNYKVTMTTKITVPAGIENIRLWHALPTPRTWSVKGDGPGAAGITFSKGGEQKFEKEHDSHHVFWKTDSPKEGTKLSYQTTMIVPSVARSFPPDKANVTWDSYSKAAKDAPKVDPKDSQNVDPQIAAVADGIRKNYPPNQAVLQFVQWVGKTLKYDASVPYSSTDVPEILKNKRGHCGHHYTLFHELCVRAGIPDRRVAGLNLYAPNGIGELSKIRADYTNVHTWAEVYFPGIGWVEIDPGLGNNAYSIPAAYVQNNPWFQNYAVWYSEGGQDKYMDFEMKNGKYSSRFKLEHLVTYTESKGK